jgi:hypothetical protein
MRRAERRGKMKFSEKTTLAENISSPSGGWVDVAIPDGETLLIGEEWIAKWYEHADDRGGWDVYIFPVYHNGKKAFLERSRWCAREGCSSGNDGKIETILSFCKGIKKAMEKGAVDWMFKKD